MRDGLFNNFIIPGNLEIKKKRVHVIELDIPPSIEKADQKLIHQFRPSTVTDNIWKISLLSSSAKMSNNSPRTPLSSRGNSPV